MKKKIWCCTIIIVVVAAALVGGFYFYKSWWPQKKAKIDMGLSSNKFPWRDYTQDELNKMYPQIKYANVPTRTTPEQTYANFREALKTNNLELVLEQLNKDSKNYEVNKKAIEKAYNENKFFSIYEKYPEKLEREYMAESMGQLYFLEKNGSRYPIDFIKDANGDWKMDSL